MVHSKKEIYVILPDIRSVHNVGSIFRTADAVGVTKIFLTGYTPTPLSRFGILRSDFAKVSLGAEKTVPWQYEENVFNVFNDLKKEGVEIIAVEQVKNSIDYKKLKITKATAFVFGTEVTGLPKKILDQCDCVCEIPMLGKKESLNVSVSFGVIIFRALGV